jgi:hypothetical protein
MNMMDRKYELTRNNKMIPLVMMAIGLVAIVMGFLSDPTRTWATLLHNNFYFTAIALCGTFFVAVQYIAQAGWAVGIKRIPEAMGGFLKYGMLGMILIFIFGHHDLYHWTHHELYDPASPSYDQILAGKQGFLNIPFYLIRMVAYAAIWVGFTYVLRKHSIREDEEGGLLSYRKSVTLGAVFIVLFAITSSTSAWDFIMSIDSHWYSTLFGWYTFAGLFVSGLSMMCLLILFLRSKGYMDHVKFMFAFSVFWTYLWFSQFMLIWYANIPEEVVYYQVRWEYFKKLWVANLIINFCAPLLILMTRDSKRQTSILWVAGIIILAGHWLDVYLMVTPGVLGKDWHIGFIELGTLVGYLGLFIRVTLGELTKAYLVPRNHPMLQESMHHHI